MTAGEGAGAEGGVPGWVPVSGAPQPSGPRLFARGHAEIDRQSDFSALLACLRNVKRGQGIRPSCDRPAPSTRPDTAPNTEYGRWFSPALTARLPVARMPGSGDAAAGTLCPLARGAWRRATVGRLDTRQAAQASERVRNRAFERSRRIGHRTRPTERPVTRWCNWQHTRFWSWHSWFESRPGSFVSWRRRGPPSD